MIFSVIPAPSRVGINFGGNPALYKKKITRRECPMALKEGDRIRISSIGGDYRVKWVGQRMVVLETDDRSRQFLTTLDYLQADSARQPKATKGMPPADLKN